MAEKTPPEPAEAHPEAVEAIDPVDSVDAAQIEPVDTGKINVLFVCLGNICKFVFLQSLQ
jgi:hypothetical protein